VQLASGGEIVVSASDLVGFLECDHLVSLELEAARGLRAKPIRDDPELELIRRRGFEHERRFLERLRAEGRSICEIATRDIRTPDELRAAEAETLAAIARGEDVIFQATFFDGRWRGHADFLLRRDDRSSDLGPWSYDIADTKLARRVKAAAILQMCVYADLLERLQGVAPETVSVVTGDGVAHPHRLADYAAYYRAAKRRFEARVFETQTAVATYPEPVEHCRVCPWFSVCIERRRVDDHLSIVAGVSRAQRARLVEAGIPTLEALATLDEDARIARIPPRILERLRHQAALQLGARRTGRLSYELIPPQPELPGRGLAALPEPSALDIFFDIEADPWALEDGLEYLFGWIELDPGEPSYRTLWGHDRETEKQAFETFVDIVTDRLGRDPEMHVYHYGGYESGALKRLMQRHATREDEVDRLLRGRVLVNLYDHVVRPGLRASVESYSIKKIEKFYMPEREGGITEAGFSVVEYERWMETRDQSILDAIAAYNRDDCLSNLGLRDWLEELRIEAAPMYPEGIVPRPAPVDGAPSAKIETEQDETHRREAALRAGVPADRSARNEEEQARWLLAGLLDWHRREAKPQWWLWYELRDASIDDLIAHPEALGGLEPLGEIGARKRSIVMRYRFDPTQDTKIKEGDRPTDPATGETAGDVVGMDPLAGTIDLKRSAGRPDPAALIPATPFGSDKLREALGRLADDVLDRGIDAPGRYRAARDLILRRPPRVRATLPDASLLRPDETPVAAARRLALDLEGTTLPIQGPPGTGKTSTGAQMIVDLVRRDRRVGVTAQSHKVIANMLEAVARAAMREALDVRIAQRCDEGEGSIDGRIACVSNEAAHHGLADGTFQVVGGTPWLWARPEMDGSIDLLVIDEAGQVSLANACAMVGAADSMVLLGDPNQLPQVSQGTHPEGAAASALEHLVADAKTIAPDRGLLLSTTYRLHPDVNAFVSEVFYEGRLVTDAANARQELGAGSPVGGTGLRHVSIGHRGAANRSRDEATWIADAIQGLVGRQWTDRNGVARPLAVGDVLIVAPYNAQVAEIAAVVEQRLGARPNVGTVDRFQGREAPVAIYSMATSTPDEAPRDAEFLYSGNRFNVAISRARGLAVLVANDALLRFACRTPAQMRLLNAFCRYAELAAWDAAVHDDSLAGPGALEAVELDRPIALTLGL
jgi:predicted RecB family nuclease